MSEADAEASPETSPEARRPAGVHVELRGLSKNYGGTRAVRDLDLEILPGTVHAIVGENGAGKSTVSKMIAGMVAPTAGEILVNGERVSFSAPRDALDLGIAFIEQELSLVSGCTVIENVFLGVELNRAMFLNRAAQRARYAELARDTGFDIDGSAKVQSLRVADQQKVEIIRALARDGRFIIMDEPTAPLTPTEAEQLHSVVRDLRESGATVLYISHFLEEVLEIADTVTVMRDGAHVSTKPTVRETVSSLVEGMLGRTLELALPPRRPVPADLPPLLTVHELSAVGRLTDVSFELHPGEIVGIAGLVGSGRTELLRTIAGADRFDSGEIRIDGKPTRWRSPADAIAKGVIMLPESRKDEGLVMSGSVSSNILLTGLGKVSRFSFMRRGRAVDEVTRLMAGVDVRASGPHAPISSLSGGNQQKVLFAKCLMSGPRVLLVDEPTRGVDVGAKRAIYELVLELAGQGMAMVVVSSELEEVLGLAHRVLVMREGRLVAEFSAEEADDEKVLAAAFGADAQPV